MGARPYGRDTNVWYEITNLLGGRHDVPILRIVARCAEGQPSGEQQERAERKQAPAPSALSIHTMLRRRFEIDRRVVLTIKGFNVIHSIASSNTP